MAKTEKIFYILEQVRLCLDRKDYIRCVSPAWQDAGTHTLLLHNAHRRLQRGFAPSQACFGGIRMLGRHPGQEGQCASACGAAGQ